MMPAEVDEIVGSLGRELVAAYPSALAPGSYVVISVARGEERIGQQVTRAYDAAPLHNHPPGDVASFFAGMAPAGSIGESDATPQANLSGVISRRG